MNSSHSNCRTDGETMTRKSTNELSARLYHGTSTANLDRILDEGITPRSADSLGCWPDEVSMDGHTYLTRAHALHFAAAAVDQGHRQNVSSQLLILEVDCRQLDSSLLRPDEDYLTQTGLWSRCGSLSVQDNTHISQVPHLWPQSLEKIGNLAVAGTVPPEAITRYAVVQDEYDVVHDFYRQRGDHDIHVFPGRSIELMTVLEFLFDRKMHAEFSAGRSKTKLRAMYPHLSLSKIANFGHMAECLWVGFPRCRRAARRRSVRV